MRGAAAWIVIKRGDPISEQLQSERCAQPGLLSPLNLAFVGDAVYELKVRARIVSAGTRPVGELHKETVGYVCAQAQSAAYEELCGLLTEQELGILKRGRNASSVRAPKSSSVIEYRRATAVEALLGYLYLRGEDARLDELVECIIACIRRLEQGEEVHSEVKETALEGADASV